VIFQIRREPSGFFCSREMFDDDDDDDDGDDDDAMTLRARRTRMRQRVVGEEEGSRMW
jgi:hypothetical protein